MSAILMLLRLCLTQLHISPLRSWFYTFLFPSTALMPMEYCMSLTDTADVVEDGAFVVDYRDFVLERTGVELIIET